MTYRSDHDAAVARVDALQHEVKRLAEENAKLRIPAARARKPSIVLGAASVIGACTITAIGCLLLGITVSAKSSADPVPEPVASAEAPVVPKVHEMPVSLLDCAKAIGPHPVIQLRKPLDVAALERTGASCRKELRVLANNDPVGRDSVSAWARAEDQLSNRISLLTVYYSSDPATVDNYAAAPRLWAEYETAWSARNAALEVWRSRR